MRYVIAAVLCSASLSSLAQPLEIDQLLKAERIADSNCRGSNDPGNIETQMECDRRSRLYGRLSQAGYCYGIKGQVGADFRWHRCGPRSNYTNDLSEKQP